MPTIRLATAALLAFAAAPLAAQQLTVTAERPLGTLREQAALQQRWLDARLRDALPPLLRRHKVDAWVIPMREYNEDPVFSSLVAPTTFAARRRTIYVFIDKGAKGVERIALGGTSQGGVFKAVRSQRAVPSGGQSTGRQAELWGDSQWEVLAQVLAEHDPKRIAINTSRTWAFADGLSSGELEGMRKFLGEKWTRRFVPAEGLAVDLIATRSPEEAATFQRLVEVTWSVIDEMFSGKVVTPGVTRTSDLVWFFRQRVNDLGLGTWFQPSVNVQRKGWTPERLGEDPVIERGDHLWCDVGITALRLNTDIQHVGYVLREGETAPPPGLLQALRNSNRAQDILMEEIRPGRTGNEILASTRRRLAADGLDGTIYSHPIGVHGHGAGPLIGLWDYQEGVPGRGDHAVIPNMWFSIELQVTTPVPEWDGQPVRSAQEEDMVVGPDGATRWGWKRQVEYHLVRP
ncbi:MAG: M24 family metallopeptidase [Gemmatimonadales bacterium]|nr:M24 family metallopeptidase [Gemmatimonadales bacterium]